MKVYSKSLGYIEIPKGDKSKDVTFVASGGQASIYVTNNKKHVLKIYHDSTNSIPEDKVKELSTLRHPNIITPIETVYENSFVGYYMDYINQTYDLCELFPTIFKQQNNIDFNHRKMLIEKIMDMVTFIHNHKFLIVDLNANNVLISKDLQKPYFIDTDSYKTHNHPANAIQDIIRDRKVKNNEFNEGSDWFAFACLAFNLYVGVHPYGGKHKQYKQEKNGVSVISQRLDDNISVFHKDVNCPPSVEYFKLIPKRHYDWFKDVFENGGRTTPPKADSVSNQAIPTNMVIVRSNDKLNVSEVYSFDSIIQNVWNCNGRLIFKTKNGFYEGNTKICDAGNYYPVINFRGDLVFIEAYHNELRYKDISLKYDHFQIKDGEIYRVYNGILYHDQIIDNTKAFFSSKKLSDTSIVANMSDGFIFDKCLNTNRIISFNQSGCRNYFLKDDLAKFNIISGKVAGNFALLMAKKKVNYHILYNLSNGEYVSKKASYIQPNMVSLNNIHIKLEDDKLSVFSDLNKIKIIDNSGLDDSCRLFTNGSTAFFYTNNKFYKMSTK